MLPNGRRAFASRCRQSRKVDHSHGDVNMFTVRGIAISNVLYDLKKVVTPEIVHLSYQKGRLTFAVEQDNQRVRISIPCEGEDKSITFAVNLAILEKACRNRDQLEFAKSKTSDDTGRYRTNLNCDNFDEIEIVTGKSNSVSPQLADVLVKWLPKMTLKAPFNRDEELVVLVDASSEHGVRMACADSYHLVMYQDKKLTVDKFQGRIPVSKIPAICNSIIPAAQNHFAKDGNNLLFWNNYIQMSFPQIPTERTIDGLIEATKSSGDITFESKPLREIVRNLCAFVEKNDDSVIVCRGRKGGMELSVTTSKGSSKDTLDFIQGDLPSAEFSLHPALFTEIVSKVKGIVKLQLNNRAIVLKGEKLTAACVMTE